MKSSNSANESTNARAVHAWMPADFGVPMETRQSPAQQLLEILGASADRVSALSGEDTGVIRAGSPAQDRLRGWQPGDVQQPASRPTGVETPLPVKSQRGAGGFNFPDFPTLAVEHRVERKSEARERIPEVRTEIQYVVDESKQAEIMAEARDRADQLIQQARESAAQILQQAQEEARQAVGAGFDQGHADGMAEAANAIRAAQAVIAEAAAWRDQVVSESEEAVIDMIRRIARLMFGEGLQLDKSALQIYLNEVMETTRSLGELNIFLSPSDYKQLDSAWAEYYTQIRGIRVTVIGSGNVLPGGCYVQGINGTVDARVETKLNAVLESLASDPDSGGGE